MKPIRDNTNPLPSNFPRIINAEDTQTLVYEVLKSGFTDNNVHERLTDVLSSLTGQKYVVLLNNCTSACHTALWAAGIRKGDEVICPPISDYATLFGILACGAVPVFADIDYSNGNIDPEKIRANITPKTRAIIAVHFWGITCEIDRIMKIASEYSIPVLEDCCQAPFANYRNKITGSFGDISLFSFSREKHWSADEGGALLTNNEEYAKAAALFAINRGARQVEGFGRYHSVLGYNYRPSTLSLSLALAQLKKLPQLLERRRDVVLRLNQHLDNFPHIILPRVPTCGDNLAWIFHFKISGTPAHSINELATRMRSFGLKDIDTAPYYYLPDSCAKLLEDAYHNSAQAKRSTNCKYAKKYISRVLRWFMTEKYSDQDILDISKIIKISFEASLNQESIE